MGDIICKEWKIKWKIQSPEFINNFLDWIMLWHSDKCSHFHVVLLLFRFLYEKSRMSRILFKIIILQFISLHSYEVLFNFVAICHQKYDGCCWFNIFVYLFLRLYVFFALYLISMPGVILTPNPNRVKKLIFIIKRLKC